MKIQLDKIYSLTDIDKAGFIYWVGSIPTLKKLVKRDLADKNILQTEKTTVKNKPSQTRYYIWGFNIEKFIKEFKKGKAFSDPRHNHTPIK